MYKNVFKKVIISFLILALFSTTAFALKAVCDQYYGGGFSCVGTCYCTGVGAGDAGPCHFYCWDEHGSYQYCYSECDPEYPI